MDKGDRITVDALLSFGPEQTDTLRREVFDRRVKIFDSERKMMDAAARISFKEFPDRRFRIGRLDQFQFGIAEIEANQPHALPAVYPNFTGDETIVAAQHFDRRL